MPRVWIHRVLGFFLVTTLVLAACSQAPAAPTAAPAKPAAPAATAAPAQPAAAPPTSAPAAAKPATGSRVFTVAVPAMPKSLGDRFAAQEWAIMRYDLGRLIVVDEQGKFQPWLALSWKATEPTVWQFKLRPNVKWENGDPFTADDVKFSLDFMLDPNNKHPQRDRIKEVTKVEVADPLTVNVHTDKPSGAFISNVPSTIEILPAKYYKQVGNAGFDSKPIGVGPFKVKELVPGSHVSFVPNELFWGDKPKVDQVVFRAIPEEATRLAALEAGEIDAAYNITPENAPRLKQKGFNVVPAPENRVMTLIAACDRPNGKPLCDTRVRQAIAMAIDLEGISQALYAGLFPVAKGHPANPTMFGFNPNLKPYPYDVKRAKELLAQAGYASGFKIALEYPQGRWTKVKELAETLAAQLQAIGVTVEQIPEDSGTWLARYTSAKTVEMTLSTLGPAFDLDFNTTRFACGNAAKFFCDQEFDAAYTKQRTITDIAEREKALHNLGQVFNAKVAGIALLEWQAIWAFGPKVKNIHINPDVSLDILSISKD